MGKKWGNAKQGRKSEEKSFYHWDMKNIFIFCMDLKLGQVSQADWTNCKIHNLHTQCDTYFFLKNLGFASARSD